MGYREGKHKRNWEDDVDTRDYMTEARNLIRGLDRGNIYELYEIVHKKMKKGNSPTRDKELQAVKQAIEERRDLDKNRLSRVTRPYSDMASTGRARDGQTTVNRKKV